MQTISLAAPAKINLHLSVVGKRPDGYHLLETLMAKLDLADRLTITKGGNGIGLKVVGADLPENEDNLVFKAAGLFFRQIGRPENIDLVLEKSIPVAAGLGGGSSDAASTLLGLNRLFGNPIDDKKLGELGLSLGADVPFFLYPETTAWAEGIGEKLQPGPELPNSLFLIVNPGWPLSTAAVFQKYKIELTTDRRNLIVRGQNASSFTIVQALHNDLEKVVLPEFPELGGIKERLIEYGARGALMTGSGPTMFGVFDSPEVLERARRQLVAEGGDGWLVTTARISPAPHGHVRLTDC